jgi:hypothetical protein
VIAAMTCLAVSFLGGWLATRMRLSRSLAASPAALTACLAAPFVSLPAPVAQRIAVTLGLTS